MSQTMEGPGSGKIHVPLDNPAQLVQNKQDTSTFQTDFQYIHTCMKQLWHTLSRGNVAHVLFLLHLFSLAVNEFKSGAT